MATVYISELSEMTSYQGNNGAAADGAPVAEQTVAITGASLQSAAFNAKTRLVRVHADAVCSIAFGANPTATTARKRLAQNQTEYFRVAPGHRVAVITNT